MAEDGQLARIAGRPEPAEPGLADLLDPIALEERLREARARRAEALARRPEGATVPRTDALAAPRIPIPAFLSRRAAESAAPRRTAAATLVLIFLAGLGAGGAVVAVLALRALPARIATAPAASAPAVFVPASGIAPTVATSPPADAPAAPATAGPAPETSAPAQAFALPEPGGLAAPTSEAAPTPAIALPVLEAALPPAPPPPNPTAIEAPAAEAPAATAPAADQPALPARVLIHYPTSASESAAEARDLLRSAGVGQVEIVPVRFAIGRSNIRFYHDGDGAPAAALAPLVATALEGDPPEARDFTDYATPAAPGTVEIWLAGDPGAASPRTAARVPARTAPSTPRQAASTFQMPGVIAPPPSQAEQVERILIERLRLQSR